MTAEVALVQRSSDGHFTVVKRVDANNASELLSDAVTLHCQVWDTEHARWKPVDATPHGIVPTVTAPNDAFMRSVVAPWAMA